MRYLAVLCLLACALSLHAQTSPGSAVQLGWVPSTKREDGSAYTNPAGYKVYRSETEDACVGQPLPLPSNCQLIQTIPNPGIRSYTDTGLIGGKEYWWALTSFDMNGIESRFSNRAMKAIPIAPPLPPGNVTASAVSGETAYTIQSTDNRLVLVAVGTVQEEAPCDTSQALRDANGLTAYVVPQAAVHYASASFQPKAVLARCSS